MAAPTRGPSTPPRQPRRRRAGRPVRRRRAWLTSSQATALGVGAAIAATLLYLVILRGSSDPGERVTGNRVAVTLSEFKIVPQSINVKQGNLQLIVTNKGKQIHNLQIESIVDPASDAQPTILLRVPAMQPGQTKESPAGGATLPPGKYVWRSSISNDDDLGMYGNVEVRQ